MTQPTATPPPPGSPGADQGPPDANRRPPTPAHAPVSQVPQVPATVPFCQLVGQKLYNLAMYDSNGNVWEYQKNRGKNRVGRLTLIDFWSSGCGPCQVAMPSIRDLHQAYEPYGLDVVGIAYESGSTEQRVSNVRSIRGRYQMKYPTLMGDPGNCPVLNQFNVQGFPTVVLLDENGVIVFRARYASDHLDSYATIASSMMSFSPGFDLEQVKNHYQVTLQDVDGSTIASIVYVDDASDAEFGERFGTGVSTSFITNPATVVPWKKDPYAQAMDVTRNGNSIVADTAFAWTAMNYSTPNWDAISLAD